MVGPFLKTQYQNEQANEKKNKTKKKPEGRAMFETKCTAQSACSLAPRQATKKKLLLKFLTSNLKEDSGDVKASPHGLSQTFSPLRGGGRRATRERVKEKTG